MIPEVACRHLIGARGDRIKLLREESRCEASTASGLGEFAEESTIGTSEGTYTEGFHSMMTFQMVYIQDVISFQ